MATQSKYLPTFEEYLDLERTAEFRSEYQAGGIYAMAGGTDVHSRFSARSVVVLDRHLSRCQIYDGNLKTYIEATNEGVYPDAMVICDEPRFWNNQADVIVNPMLVVEVLSPSTQGHDGGSKAVSYRTIPELRHILVISQERVFVEHYARQSEKNWLITEYAGPEDMIEFARDGNETPGTLHGDFRMRFRRAGERCLMLLCGAEMSSVPFLKGGL